MAVRENQSRIPVRDRASPDWTLVTMWAVWMVG